MSSHVAPGAENELTRKQELLITALLSLPTVKAAAQAAGVNERTAQRWLKEPHIKQAYKDAQHAAFDESLAILMSGTNTALSTLLSTMKDKDVPEGVRVRAATVWLENAVQVHKFGELEKELNELKQIVKERLL